VTAAWMACMGLASFWIAFSFIDESEASLVMGNVFLAAAFVVALGSM
jgi:hypothetical protein